MQEITSHKPGTMCWVDLSTTNQAEARKFYNMLFGWESTEVPSVDGRNYTILSIGGKPVAALSEMTDEQKKMNMQPYWLPYISVENVDEILLRTNELGGGVIADAFDVTNQCRMGLISDPEGAILALWQPKDSIGMYYKNIHGTLNWLEHASHQPEKSIPFLEKLFGWKARTQDMGGTIYTVFSLGEEAAAGLYTMPPEMNHLPSHWLPTFLTEDIDRSIEIINANGGQILLPKMFTEEVGFYIVFRDPQGAVSGLVEEPMNK